MPIYEYRCDACGHEHEAIRKFSDAPLTTCPACGKEAIVKKVSAAGFQLKGSGWYQTDFRGGNKPAVKADNGASDDEPVGDTKPVGDAKPGGDAKSTDAAPAGKNDTPAAASPPKSAPAGGTSTPA